MEENHNKETQQDNVETKDLYKLAKALVVYIKETEKQEKQ